MVTMLPAPRAGIVPVEEAVEAIARGELVVVLDDADREDEGDLVMAAEWVTPETMAFMVRHTSGVVCVAITGDRLDELGIPLMVSGGSERMGTAFTVSVDHASTSTGISATDRATTIRALVDPASTPEDFTRPGHVFPLRVRPGGVLERPGHTEAAVDLARLAGLAPAGVLSEVVTADGMMARGRDLARFAAEHGLAMITVDDLVNYRRQRDHLVRHRSSASLPTAFGPFTIHAYESVLDGVEHVALVRGDLSGGMPVLARVHSECLTGDIFRSQRCDCGGRLQAALVRISEEGRGVVVYLRADQGPWIGDQILADLGVSSVLMIDDEAGSGGPAGCGLAV
jgi:3,4-dihydroxy 2-butanone 4-phosphate synthase/GTP cyclohydrolase II